MTTLADAAARLSRNLERHQERYIRAWVAATGIRPEDAELVQWTECDESGVVRTVTQVRRKTR